MRLFSGAALFALILFGGCATPRPAEPASVEYKAVPGPSRTTAMLPRPTTPLPTPTEDRKSVPLEKQKPAAVEKPESPSPRKRKLAPPPTTDIVMPDASLRGKVARSNEAFRFVVLEFPIAHLPDVGQKLLVYRNGLKVGEVKVTGPHRDDRTVADLTTGEAQAGDEVREQ